MVSKNNFNINLSMAIKLTNFKQFTIKTTTNDTRMLITINPSYN